MEISVGQPPVEGRYVVFVRCESRQIPEWCEPTIATWHGGRWHTLGPVYGWIGPLPPTKWQSLIDRHFLPAICKLCLGTKEWGGVRCYACDPEYDL